MGSPILGQVTVITGNQAAMLRKQPTVREHCDNKKVTLLPPAWLMEFQNNNECCNVAIPAVQKRGKRKAVGSLVYPVFPAFFPGAVRRAGVYICRFTVATRMQRCIQFSRPLQCIKKPAGI